MEIFYSHHMGEYFKCEEYEKQFNLTGSVWDETAWKINMQIRNKYLN